MSAVQREYELKIQEWIDNILKNPKNLASERELQEQGKVALKYFQDYDFDHTNTLTINELKLLCDNLGLPVEKDEDEMLMKLDKDDSGAVDLNEFILWWLTRISTLPNPMKQQEAIAKYTFSRYDKDKSGFLDHNEFRQLIEALGANFTDEEVDLAVKEIDSDNSGVIECSEFILWQTNRIMNRRQSSSMITLKLKKLAMKANQVFSTDIFTAGWNGDQELIQNFLEGEKRLLLSSDESEWGEGWTLLHYCCYKGHYDLIKYLFDNFSSSIQVNSTNNCGFTPLFYASQQGFIKIVDLLLENNADPTIFGVVSVENLGDHDQPPQHDQSNRNNLFMAPVEFILDYPELKKHFLKHPKCQKPKKISSSQLSMSITPNLPNSSNSAYSLNINLSTSVKNFSLLPIRILKVKMRILTLPVFETNPLINYSRLTQNFFTSENENDEITFKIAANCPPSSSTSSFQQAVVLETKMVHFLQFLYFNSVLDSFHLVPSKSFLGMNPASLKSEEFGICLGTYLLNAFQFFSKMYSYLNFNVWKSCFQNNYQNNLEEFFTVIFSRLIQAFYDPTADLMFDEPTRLFVGKSLENLRKLLQQNFDEKRQQMNKIKETVAKESADKKDNNLRNSQKREDKTDVVPPVSVGSKYLTLEQVKECIDKAIEQNTIALNSVPPAEDEAKPKINKPPKNVSGGDFKANDLTVSTQPPVAMAKPAELRKPETKDSKEKKSGSSLNPTVPQINMKYWILRANASTLDLEGKLLLNSILFEGDFSDPVDFKLDFYFDSKI
jgi:Ca2+-binding EF-hand superfamily protein/ankyrin repeat protein